ncbi:thioredoxin family protein [Paenibacillus xanthanilyticus]|uniref:Thioredoxin n=1 Tax=Paenibacillus xanthanilyticus TaxID=1783531 RepID=A0ABV8JYY9_9BACL
MTIRSAASHDELKRIVQEGLVLVDYGASWCPPCKVLLPILEELDRDLGGAATIVKVDCDELPDAASAAGVMSMPMVVVYKDGSPMDKLVGLRPKAAYRQTLDKYS